MNRSCATLTPVLAHHSPRGFLFVVVFLFLLFSLNGAGLCADSKGNSCIQCHLDLWNEIKGSVHSQNGIFCQNCHGGDPTQPDQVRSKLQETGYIGIPDKKTLAETCGKCHSDVAFMNFYGIRTDQLARYKTSGHGKKLFEKDDTKVAACADCHGYHDVLPVSDPNSPVYPSNVPKTCNHCHGKENLMKSYGLPADIVDTYQKSVHGSAVLEKKDFSAATCVGCHGSHGAIPPGVREIGEACGKCHINEKKYFLEGVHAEPMKQGKFSGCIACHGNHGIQHPSKFLYQEVCTKCHDPNSAAAVKGKKFFQVLSESEKELSKTEAIVKQASIEGIFVEEETGSLEEAKTNVIAMAPLQHTLSLEKITELSKRFSEVADRIQADISRKRQILMWRKIALIPIWIFVFAMAGALWAKYKRLKR